MNVPTHEQIRAYLHLGREQLQAREQTALDTHLADCADCRAYAADVAAFQTRLGRLMRLRWDPYQASPALNGQIQTRLRRQQRRRQFWQFSSTALATAALVVLVVALSWLVGRVGSLPERSDNPAVTAMVAASPSVPPLQGGIEGGHETGETAIQLTTITVASPPGEAPATPTAQPTCPVTRPNGNPPPGEIPSSDHHGNGVVWTALPPDGRALVPPEQVQRDGSLSLDWPWWQWKEGQLTITGRRLGAFSAPLQANILEGNGEIGPQSSELLFPGAGCWEITGKVGNTELTFVILVEKTQ